LECSNLVPLGLQLIETDDPTTEAFEGDAMTRFIVVEDIGGKQLHGIVTSFKYSQLELRSSVLASTSISPAIGRDVVDKR